MFFGVCIAFLVVLLTAAVSWLRVKAAAGSSLQGVTGRILLIIAHPDDECMFFAPTVLSLGKSVRAELFLLCLSEGNYYGRANIRKQELLRSAAILGISGTHVEIVNDSQLQDSPRVEWREEAIERYVLAAVKKHTISRIVTFDEKGVSEHPNHIAIHRAILKMHREEKLSSAGLKEVLLLETIPLWRKYSSFLDAAWSSAIHRHYVLSNLEEYWLARQAMQAHHSQYLWFRKLYVSISRYMLINTYHRLTIPPALNHNRAIRH